MTSTANPTSSPTAATYASLFPEQLADRCSPDALESNSGPVAYLHALYQHALELETTSPSNERFTLEQRRPDIGELLLNQEGLEKAIPPLTLAINALTRKAQSHAGADASLPQALSEAQYSAGLPFHYPLEQIKAVLRHKKLPLFDLLQQSEYSFPNFCYSNLRTDELRQIMRTSTGFSPALQDLLLDNSATTGDNFLLLRFGVTGSNSSGLTQLRNAELFCKKTGLKPEQLQDLLATLGVDDDASEGFTSVKRSDAYRPADAAKVGGHLFGASFINNGVAPALSLEDKRAGPGITLAIKGGTAAHFGRIHKIIHLQHALRLSFAEVDLLLMSAMRAEGQSRNFQITQNTLRALGVFRYFNETYGVTAEQFSALIHEVSPYAVGDNVPFLDRVLDGPGAGELAEVDDRLVIDDHSFDPPGDTGPNSDNAPQTTMGRLCRALGMNEGLATLYLTQVSSALELKKPTLSLTLVSALYRLSRLPRLLRLSLDEGACLIALLAIGNSQVNNRLAGQGRISDEAEDLDILDVLIGLANLQRWLHRESLTAQTVLRLLTPIPTQPSEALGTLYGVGARLRQAASQALPTLRDSLLTEDKVKVVMHANLPLNASERWLDVPAVTTNLTGSQGNPTKGKGLLGDLINKLGILKQQAVELTLEDQLNAALLKKVPEEVDRKDAVKILHTLLTNARIAQEDVTKNIISTAFNDGAQDKGISANHALPLLRWMGTTPNNLLSDVLAAAISDETSTEEVAIPFSKLSFNLWATLSKYAQVVKLVQLSPVGLTALLENPQWFDLEIEKPGEADNDNPQAELRLDLFYQLTRYRELIGICRSHRLDEIDALDYLTNVPDSDKTGAVDYSATQLGRLIGWTANETLNALPYISIITTGQKSIIKRSYDDFLTLLSVDEQKYASDKVNQILTNYHWLAKNNFYKDKIIQSINVKFTSFIRNNPGTLKVTQAQYSKIPKSPIWWDYAKIRKAKGIEVENPTPLELEIYSEEEQKSALGISEKQMQTVASTVTDIDYVMRLRALGTTTGLSCHSLLSLSLLDHTSTYKEFSLIAQLLLDRYGDEDLQVIEPALQEQWRDALVAYLMGYWVGSDNNLKTFIRTTDDFSSYFLTDIDVSHESRKTNSISQTIASLQHYLYRLHSHLEPGYDASGVSGNDSTAWHKYLSQYGTWKQGRAQINHPENLIYYANRPNKTKAFQELEVEVNQGKLDTELLHSAVCNYLTKFERISNLQVVSGYLDGHDPKTDTYYLIGKSNASPAEYYWRSVDMGLRDDQQRLSPLAWSEWEKISLPISGQIAQSSYIETVKDENGTTSDVSTHYSEAIRPVIIAGRPYVFWVERGVTGLPSADDKNQTPTRYKKLSVQYAYQQSDSFWSTANELICLDGTQNGKRMSDDSKNTRLKDDTYVPGLIVFVNVEGERESDPWLTVLLYDCAKRRKDDPPGVRDTDYFIEMRDLLLIDKKRLEEVDGRGTPASNKTEKIVTMALKSYQDIRSIQHPYDGESKAFTATKLGKGSNPGSSAVPNGYTLTATHISISASQVGDLRKLKLNLSLGDGQLRSPDYSFSSAKIFYVFISVEVPGRLAAVTQSTAWRTEKKINKDFVFSAEEDGEYKVTAWLSMREENNANRILEQKNSFDIKTSNQDERWDIKIGRNAEQAQYFDLRSASHSMPTYASDYVRLNTLFGKQLVARASQSVDRVLEWDTQTLQEPTIDENNPSPPVDFHGANGLYFRELFLHLPAMIATRLTEQQQFEDAEAWYLRYLFDPYRATLQDDGRPEYWNSRPLAEVGTLGSELRKSVDPTARAFILSRYYRQAVFLSLVENWQRQGDHYYRQLTLSSLNHAWLCYQQALKLIGPLPERAAVSRWSPMSLSDTTQASFRTPINQRVIEARKIIERRLYNLRHGLTLDGKALPDMSWSDEDVDPFASAKGGLSIIASSYNSDRAAIPAYRFNQLLPLARAAAQQLLDLGRHYMKLMEDEFNTSFSVLLKAQEVRISDFTLRLKKEAISSEIARKRILELSRDSALYRQQFYTDLIQEGRNTREEAAAALIWTAGYLNFVTAPLSVAEGAAKAIPRIFGLAIGGSDISGPVQAAKEIIDGTANSLKFTSDQLLLESGYDRRAHQWEFDKRQAEFDVKHIEAEISAQNIELNAATISLEESRQERFNLDEAYVAMTTGFTIIPIYNWLVARQELIYGAAYDAVLSLCLSLEAAWRYEIGDYKREAFIKTSAWSDSYKGMLAGESLLVDLQQMENAYLLANERRLTIKKSFSLKKLLGDSNWQASINILSESKPLLFDFKANDFDKNYPGHYLRQLKHVSVSFVLEAGATLDELSAILTQTGSTTLVDPDADGATYLYTPDKTAPASVKRNLRAQQQIALSSLVSDDGMGNNLGDRVYQLVFQDGRYLPFEGTGAISQWQLVIPDVDVAKSLIEDRKNKIKDIQVNLLYTALNGNSEFTSKINELRKGAANTSKANT